MLVGPVVGRVGETFANLLVEADTACVLDVNLVAKVAASDKSQPSVRTLRFQVPANRPVTLLLKGLSPGTAYRVILGGVRAPDIRACQARFRTFDAEQPHLVIAVVGHGAPTVHTSVTAAASAVADDLRLIATDDQGSADAARRQADGGAPMGCWCELARRVRAGEVDIVVHVGGQLLGHAALEAAEGLWERYRGAEEWSEDVVGVGTEGVGMTSSAREVRGASRSRGRLGGPRALARGHR